MWENVWQEKREFSELRPENRVSERVMRELRLRYLPLDGCDVCGSEEDGSDESSVSELRPENELVSMDAILLIPRYWHVRRECGSKVRSKDGRSRISRLPRLERPVNAPLGMCDSWL